MTTYKALSTNSLSFSLSKEGQWIGNLVYNSWFSFKAKLELKDHPGLWIEPQGTWGTTIELKNQEKVILNFKMNWSGNIVLHAYLGAEEKTFVFKNNNFFKGSYALTDEENEVLLTVQPRFKWNKLSYEYEIMTTDVFDGMEQQDILLLAVIHCANYYMSMMTGTMVATVVT